MASRDLFDEVWEEKITPTSFDSLWEEVEAPVPSKKKELASAGVRGLAKGAGGTYGDVLSEAGSLSRVATGNPLDALASLFGLGSSPEIPLQASQEREGALARQGAEHEILGRLLAGEKVSSPELAFLSDEEVAPSYSRLPTSEDIGKYAQELGMQPPTSRIGKSLEKAGQIAGGAAATGAPLSTVGGLGARSLLGDILAEITGNEGLGTAFELLAPSPAKTLSKVIPSTKKSRSLLEEGRKLGLKEKELAPLIASQKKQKVLGRVAKKGGKTEKRLKEIQDALGPKFEEFGSKGARIELPSEERDLLRRDFEKVRDKVDRGLAKGPDKKAALDFIEDAVKSLDAPGATLGDLVATGIDINEAVNWKRAGIGKKDLNSLKEPMRKIIDELAPEWAREYRELNKLYAKKAAIQKTLTPKGQQSWLSKYGPTGVALGLAKANPKVLTGIAGYHGARYIARESLINPRFQNLNKRLIEGINHDNPRKVAAAMQGMKKELQKEYPDENWDFFEEIIEES